MSILAKSSSWLYHEFGLASVRSTGPNGWLIILARSCRMFSFGAVSLILTLFLSALDFSDVQIGAFMTLTLAGDVVLSLLVAVVADGIGRRRVFLVGGAMMALSGLVFVHSDNYWVLLAAAVFGVISATGGDFGPFRSIEESTLAHLTSPTTRADVLSWYVTTSALGSAAGTEISGKLVARLRRLGSGDRTVAYHLMFWVYVAMGLLSIVLASLLSRKCELAAAPEKQSGAAETRPLLRDGAAASNGSKQQDGAEEGRGGDEKPRSWWRKSVPSTRISQISAESRPVIIKLWILLTIDSLADGMVSDPWTSLFFTRKFGLAESSLGDIMATSSLLMGASTIFAGPLARRLGLVKTMVFTHLPSSAAVLLLGLPKSIGMTTGLFFFAKALNSMDQAPRSALIAAIVRPEERTVVMGITATLRTLAAAVGPSLTGYLAGSDRFWIAYVIAGTLRIGYDLGLFWIFMGIQLHKHEGEST